MSIKCPICGRTAEPPAAAPDPASPPKLPPNFPFCSRRCRLLDLGRWFDGNYRIPGAPVDIAEDGPRPSAPGAADAPRDGAADEGT